MPALQPLLIVALGNPILSDDRVGLEVARRLLDRLPPGTAELRECSVGGIELLHVLEGWERVLIIDAVEPGVLPPGEMRELAVSALAQAHAPLTPHNAGLHHCLELGRACGLQMPDEVRVFAIGVRDPYTFSERCTAEVEQAIPGIVDEIAARVLGSPEAAR